MTSHVRRYLAEEGLSPGACHDPPLTEDYARRQRAARAAERARLAVVTEFEPAPPEDWVDASDGSSAFRVSGIPGSTYVRTGGRFAVRVSFVSDPLGWDWCASGGDDREWAWTLTRAEAFAAADAWLAERGLT